MAPQRVEGLPLERPPAEEASFGVKNAAAALISSVKRPRALEKSTSGLNDHRLVPMFRALSESYCPRGAETSSAIPTTRSCSQPERRRD